MTANDVELQTSTSGIRRRHLRLQLNSSFNRLIPTDGTFLLQLLLVDAPQSEPVVSTTALVGGGRVGSCSRPLLSLQLSEVGDHSVQAGINSHCQQGHRHQSTDSAQRHESAAVTSGRLLGAPTVASVSSLCPNTWRAWSSGAVTVQSSSVARWSGKAKPASCSQ